MKIVPFNYYVKPRDSQGLKGKRITQYVQETQ